MAGLSFNVFALRSRTLKAPNLDEQIWKSSCSVLQLHSVIVRIRVLIKFLLRMTEAMMPNIKGRGLKCGS